jgi:hypothetical protein
VPVRVVVRTPDSKNNKTSRIDRHEESIALEKGISNILMMEVVYKSLNSDV